MTVVYIGDCFAETEFVGFGGALLPAICYVIQPRLPKDKFELS